MLIKDIISKFEKSKIKAGDGKSSGLYPLYTCSPVVNKYLDNYLFDDEAIIISTGGNFSIHYVNGKFNYSTDCFVFKTDKYNLKYLYYNLKSKSAEINKMFRGAGLKHLNKDEFLSLNIDDISRSEQAKIANVLDLIEKCINLKRNEIIQYDELIKSQFAAMFGTPLINSNNYNIKTADEVCLKITDGSHYSPVDIQNGYPMLSVKDMRNDGFHYESCKHISDDDFNKLKNMDCVPKKNDLLISKDGSYFYYGFVVEEEKEEAILSSIAILRPNVDIVDPFYLRYYMMSDEIVDLVSKNYVTGAALKRVILKGIKKIPVMIPPIDQQKEFAKHVCQVNKQRIECEQILNELEELQSSLEQEYFN